MDRGDLPIDLAPQYAAVLANEAHDLSPRMRWQLYNDLTQQGGQRGLVTCGWLSVLAAQRVEPFWSCTMLGDGDVADMIRLARRSLTGDLEPAQAEAERSRAGIRFNIEPAGIWGAELPYAALRAGQAAYGALVDAVAIACDRLFPFLTESFSPGDGNLIVDPWSVDAALWAADAEAGAVWELGSDPRARRRFWEWWLSSALPSAWELAVGTAGHRA